MTVPTPPALVVAHPGFGEGLREAARHILGFDPPLEVLSNEGLAAQELGVRLTAWLDAHPGPALLLTDLGPGSCGQAARRAARGRFQVAVISGVNLPLVLAWARGTAEGGFDAILAHLAARGRDGLTVHHDESAS